MAHAAGVGVSLYMILSNPPLRVCDWTLCVDTIERLPVITQSAHSNLLLVIDYGQFALHHQMHADIVSGSLLLY